MPSGRQFPCLPVRSLLESGLTAGLALPFRCANGSCGDCRATVLRGEIKKIRQHDYTLTEAEKIAGVCLLCSNVATTDVTLSVNLANSVEDIPVQELRAKLCRLEHYGKVYVVGFKFVRGKAFRYLPGQQAHVQFPGGDSFQLPIASCPCDAQYIEFHLSDHGNGAQIIQHIASLSSRDRIIVQGPVGKFTLSAYPNAPKLFIAIDEGFASVQSLIEQVLNLELETVCALIWIASERTGHYRHNLCRSWADAIDEFCYFPTFNASSLVVLLHENWPIQLSCTEVYVSAPGRTSTALENRLRSAGIEDSRLYINQF